jgi:RNA-binding protein
MTLSSQLKKALKAKAHHLKPVILIGNNALTDAVNKEIDRALHDHELIKIRIATEDRNEKKEIVTQLCAANHAELINIIGKIAIVYRKNDDNN